MIDYAKLKDEIENDPDGLGYKGHPPTVIARLLNKPKSGVQVLVDAEIPTWRLLDCINPTELEGLTARQLNLLHLVVSAGTINLSSPRVRAILAQIFPSGTKTADNLRALIYKTGSRAEELFGYGVRVTHTDVVRALRLKEVSGNVTA